MAVLKVIAAVCIAVACIDASPSDTAALSADNTASESQTVLAAGQQQAGTNQLSVAGKCFLTLAGLYFAIHALLYVVRYKKSKMPPLDQNFEALMAPMNTFDMMFTQEKLENAQDALAFVPVMSILILFVMFRAHVQSIAVPGLIQWGMLLATGGIWLQALDLMDVRIVSTLMGNLSEKLGFLGVYAGYGIVVYGVLTVKDPDIPLSAAAKCLVWLVSLVFGLLIVIKYLEYRKTKAAKTKAEAKITIDENKGLLDNSKAVAGGLDAATSKVWDEIANNEDRLKEVQSTCGFVEIICIILFYFHFRMLKRGAPVPASAVSAMYFAVWGVYLQAASILILSRVHDYAATAGRAVGLVMCYGGFGTVCFFAVMDGEIPSVGVACAVELIAVVAVIKIGLVIMEEYMSGSAPVEKKKMFEDMLATTGFAKMLTITMLYIHFRCTLITGATPPVYLELCEYAASYSIFIQVMLILIEGMVGNPDKVAMVKTVCIFMTYVGFFGIVYAAFDLKPKA